MTKYILTILLLVSLSIAKTGGVTGKVVTADGFPVEYANVGLKGTSIGSVTNTDGIFRIPYVEPGSYILVVSYVGKETKEIAVIINADKEVKLPDIVLNETAKQLAEIEVRGEKNRFSKESSDFVAKLPLKNIENPQVYTTITSDLLQDQVVTNFNDALKNAPGLDKLWESTGRGGDGAGYYSLRGFAVQPKMVNGLPGLTNGGLDPANIESIEVIKGPSGTLFGGSLISYGGLINVVTKKPYHFDGSDITYVTGSFGLNRAVADINRTLNKDNSAALRLVASFHSEDSFQDAGFRKSYFLAPSFSYEVNDRLSFRVSTEFYNTEGTNQTMIFLNRSNPLVAADLEALNYNNKLSYTSNDVVIENPAYNLQAEMNYKLSKAWTSQTVISRSSAKSKGYYSYLWDFADGAGSYGRYVSRQNSTTTGFDFQQNFIGDFKIGKLRNRVVAGIDYFSQSTINNSTGYVLYDMVAIGGKGDASNISRPSLDTALAKSKSAKTVSDFEIISAYLSDVINITSRLSFMGSIRFDYFNNKGAVNYATDVKSGNFNQSTFSPKLGLVYQIVENQLAIFTNYMNGFKNTAPRTQDDGTSKTFKPEQANQWEVGLKTDLFGKGLSAAISYYDIKVSNVVREEPSRKNFYIQDGENYSKGFELNLTASPIDGLNMIAGYSYNDSKITQTDNADYLGRRPESAGAKNRLNAWISYRVNSGALKGFGIGLGGNYYSENEILNRASTGVFTLPAYTIFNGSIYYDNDSFRVTVKMNNITNKEYYKGWSTINPQMPRNLLTSISFRF